MADTKISALAETASPAGSDVLAIVSGGSTKKVQVTNLISLTSATTSAEGTVELATNAEVQTGTDTARVSPLSAMKHHEGACKAWARFDGSTAGITAADSYNVSSIGDDATGEYSINFTTAFNNANYAVAAWAEEDTNSYARALVSRDPNHSATAIATTGCGINTVVSSSGSKRDFNNISVAFFGDQI